MTAPMFRFSRRYARYQELQAQLAETRRQIEMEKKRRARWREKNPERDIRQFMNQWSKNRDTAMRAYAGLMIQFMSMSDGLVEANKTLRFGLEAPNADIPLDGFEELAQHAFTLRLFEILADNCNLSSYTRELMIQRLVQREFGSFLPTSKKPRARTGPVEVVPFKDVNNA